MLHGVYFGWALAIPALLSIVYSAATLWVKKALGAPITFTFGLWLRNTAPVLAVFVFWCTVPAPLALFYILVFASRLLGGLGRKGSRLKELFLINLSHLLSISLHMILIGGISLAQDVSMKALLDQPFWRILTLSAVVLLNILAYALTPSLGLSLAVIRTQADSEEMRPFLTFLWFCNLSLLMDSILCSSPIEWDLLPLFLVGSTLLLELYLFRFLANIYSILKVNYLEEENRRLAKELERQAQKAEELRTKGNVDALTGLYSRRYILDLIGHMLQNGEPFSLAYLDLDKLKQVNDLGGHQAGDCYLVQFCRLMERRLRKSDLFARIGGDEFIVILPKCGKDDANDRLEQIRLSLAQESCNGRSFSFSFGVAEAQDGNETDLEQLLKRADQAMYQDKKRC